MADYSNGKVYINRSALAGVNSWIVSAVGYRLRSVCAPVVYVYPDVTLKDEKQVAAYLSRCGIEEYVCRESAAAVVFAPCDTVWGHRDVEAYMTVTQNFTDNSDVLVKEGIVQGYAPGEYVKFDRHPEGKYSGSTGRLYVLGEGSGADFAAQYLISDELNVSTPWGALIHQEPTGMVLINASAKAGNGSLPIAAALFSCGEELQEHIIGMNGADREIDGVWSNSAAPAQRVMIWNGQEETEPFVKGLEFVSKVHRYSLGKNSSRLLMIPDFEEHGIHVSEHLVDVSDGPIEYIEYAPRDAESREAGSAPLLILLHGGGNSAEFIAWVSEYPLIGREDGLVVLSVDHHVRRSSDVIFEAVDDYIHSHPFIDTSRIYVSGFSMGSLKTQEFAAKHGCRVAAVSPQSGSSGFGATVDNVMVPLYYVGGEESPLPELPGRAGQENDINKMVEKVCAMNRVPLGKERATDDSIFGYRPDYVSSILSADGLNTITQERFLSEDGVVRTVFSSTSNMTHCTLRCNCEAAWKFMRSFSR